MTFTNFTLINKMFQEFFLTGINLALIGRCHAIEDPVMLLHSYYLLCVLTVFIDKLVLKIYPKHNKLKACHLMVFLQKKKKEGKLKNDK